MPVGSPRRRPRRGAGLGPVVLLPVVLLVLVLAGCTGGSPVPTSPAGGPPTATPTARSPHVFDCGRVQPASRAPVRHAKMLGLADTCLRNALSIGQPARFVRVEDAEGGTVRTTYVVTGPGELSISADDGHRVRARRCTGATGLFLLGTCSRDPTAGSDLPG